METLRWGKIGFRWKKYVSNLLIYNECGQISLIIEDKLYKLPGHWKLIREIMKDKSCKEQIVQIFLDYVKYGSCYHKIIKWKDESIADGSQLHYIWTHIITWSFFSSKKGKEWSARNAKVNCPEPKKDSSS